MFATVQVLEITSTASAAAFIKNGNINFKQAFRAGISIEDLSSAINAHLVVELRDDTDRMAKTWSQHYDHFLVLQKRWDLAPTSDIGGTYTRWLRDIHASVASFLRGYAETFHEVDLEMIMLDIVAERIYEQRQQEELDALIMELMFPTPSVIIIELS